MNIQAASEQYLQSQYLFVGLFQSLSTNLRVTAMILSSFFQNNNRHNFIVCLKSLSLIFVLQNKGRKITCASHKTICITSIYTNNRCELKFVQMEFEVVSW